MEKKNSGGFLQNLFSSLFGGSDLEAEKKRQLKAISKKFAKSRFKGFYKYSGNEAFPTIARFFFDIYKIIYPAQAMFQSMQNKEMLKNLVIDFSISGEIKKIEESLAPEKIIEMSKQIPVDKLKEQALQRLDQYSEYFNLEKITQIDNLYKQMIIFKDFCSFDYFFFLKKFNKTMREADFGVVPPFEKINAEYILDDLKDFISIAWTVPLDADWTNLFKLLRAFKGVEPVTLPNWKKIVSRISALKSSGSLEMMIKLISSTPGASVEIPSVTANIIEPYLDKLKAETESILNKLVNEAKSSKSNEICSQLFGNVELQQLRHYTDSLNSTLKHKGLKTYDNCEALNYLKVFLIEIFKKNIREYYDLVVVRGHWESQAMSSPFSDGYNKLLIISEQITTFDAELAEDASIGMKIKTLLPKTERDNGAKNIISRLVQDANDNAYAYISESMNMLISMGKIIKALIEDYAKQKPVLITNWKELEKYTEVPLKDFCVDVYKKIYLLTTLIKNCLNVPEED